MISKFFLFLFLRTKHNFYYKEYKHKPMKYIKNNVDNVSWLMYHYKINFKFNTK
jgi:hypothetical protein